MSVFIDTVGRGPDVVFLHGWGLHGGVFERQAAFLADRFTVHLVDLPGHGHSPLGDADGPAKVAQTLAELFPLSVQVVGWSLGGLVAQHWAASFPERVKSVALVATSPRFVREPAWPHAQTRESIEAVGANLAGAFELTLQRFLGLQLMGAPDARETLKALKDTLFSHGRPQGLEAALGWLLHDDARLLARDISCPAGLFYGAKDMITPLAAGRWLAETLPDATLTVFEQASHAPFLSHESEFAVALARHLEQHA
ncbi:pimeloyl-ACP methyl ester esterase BioH [Crenobacter cavernae]|uniref:Pimeloyl-[acyl-carrier protein] methyl ester esterase n=1 Tax=Crenobacter cavernae TaxID=2290923 RepID=A0A345Y4C4_9NEIS|nr:pimeloyl-ACP methyl ester esterase BioH [Crenobacter cavernae]AXK38776.1 pimeloyl-[acyl-carrier protein] methyl ester esterase [Crenobacter cavernae]